MISLHSANEISQIKCLNLYLSTTVNSVSTCKGIHYIASPGQTLCFDRNGLASQD